MGMFEGPETQSLFKTAAATFLKFINALAEHRGFVIDLESAKIFIEVDVLFVSDLKMIPIVFNCNHSSAKAFCPICLVNRPDHRKERSSGPVRELKEDSLLQIPIENIVSPPLHLILGATNRVLQSMDPEK